MNIWIYIFIIKIYFVVYSDTWILKERSNIQNGSLTSEMKIMEPQIKNKEEPLQSVDPIREATSIRLPPSAKPIHYRILLKPSLKKFDFHGDETITMFIKNKTDHISLNAINLTIKAISLSTYGGKKYSSLKFDIKENLEQIKIYFPINITKESVDLRILFYGKLSEDAHGFYLSRYTDSNGNEKFLASTQFESSHARKAFPCFDEPHYKATYEISLQVEDNLTALSNARMKGIEKMSDGTTRVYFESTMYMSTYIVAIVVGELKFIEGYLKSGTRVRVYSIPEKIHHGNFSLDTGIKCLNYLNEYLDFNYPLTKIDMVGVPTFAYGAMENTGLVISTTNLLLMDPTIKKYHKYKKNVATIIGHEAVHQWFGNIVTMAWWNQLWLKEGFATYLMYAAVDHSYPELKIWNQYLKDSIFKAFHADSDVTAHSLDIPQNETKTLASAYSAISYDKGGAVLRMLRNYIGKDDFQKSVQLYIKKHAYNNTITEDLWDVFQDVSGKDIHRMMNTWTKEAGHPIVSVSQKIEGNRRILKFKQKRYIFNETENNDYNQVWHIPVNILLTSTNLSKHLFVMKEREESVILENIDPLEIIMINPEVIGFYRVEYSEEMLEQLFVAIRNKKLSILNILGLSNDILELIPINKLKCQNLIKLLNATKFEEDTDLHTKLDNTIREINYELKKDKDYELLEHFNSLIIKLYLPLINKIGWKNQPNDNNERIELRARINDILSLAKINVKKGNILGIETTPQKIEGEILSNQTKDSMFSIRKLYEHINTTEYFNYIRGKDSITIIDLAALLKLSILPEAYESTFKEYMNMNIPTSYEEMISIKKDIYEKGYQIAISKDSLEQKSIDIKNLIDKNFDEEVKLLVEQKFKQIDEINRIKKNYLSAFIPSFDMRHEGLILKRDSKYIYSKPNIGDNIMIALTWIIFVFTMPFSLFFCVKIVQEYKRMVVYRLGRLRGRKEIGPGIVLILPCIDEHHTIDLRTMSYDVPSQEMLTKDSVTVSVDAAVYFRTQDPVATIARVADAHLSTKQLAQTTLRNILGTRTLSEIMAEREGIALQAQEVLDGGTFVWGIKVERVEIKDIRLPRELCRVLAAEAEASRNADARCVSAKGELDSSLCLKKAADKLSETSSAIQLRYLQTLTKISRLHNHTIVLPIPIEIIRKIMEKFSSKKKNNKGAHCV